MTVSCNQILRVVLFTTKIYKCILWLYFKSKLYLIRSWCFRVPVSLQWTKFCEAALGDDFFNAAADVKVTFIIGSHKKNPHTRLGASCIHIHKMKSVQQTSPELLFEILNHKRVCIRDALVCSATRCVFTSFLKWFFTTNV